MPRTNVTVTTAVDTGFRINAGFDVAADAVNFNEFDNDGATFLLVRNSGVSTFTVTFYNQGTIDAQAIPAKVVNVLASAYTWFGPFKREIYNQANGRVPIDCNNAGLFLQVVRVPPVG